MSTSITHPHPHKHPLLPLLDRDVSRGNFSMDVAPYRMPPADGNENY